MMQVLMMITILIMMKAILRKMLSDYFILLHFLHMFERFAEIDSLT